MDNVQHIYEFFDWSTFPEPLEILWRFGSTDLMLELYEDKELIGCTSLTEVLTTINTGQKVGRDLFR